MRLLLDHLPSPVGELALIADETGRLRALGWSLDHARSELAVDAELVAATDPGGVTRTLAAYFDGELGALDRIAVEPGGTPFQAAVWAALRTIPCGTTWSYGQLARAIGKPAAVRAVGLANGANPIAIVIPCHRVIGSDGTLTGYGGGLPRKQWLLAHERATGNQLALL